MGDGYWLEGKPAFSNTSYSLITYYQNLIRSMGFECKLYKRKKRKTKWKPELILVGEKKLSKLVTTEIKHLKKRLKNKNDCKCFLRGVFDAEGNLEFRSTRRGRETKISNTNEKLITLVEKALKTLNLKYTKNIERRDGKRKKLFNVKLYGNSSLKFIKTVKPTKLMIKEYLVGKVNPKYINFFNSIGEKSPCDSVKMRAEKYL